MTTKENIKRQYQKQQLKKKYDNLTISIRGYIKDSKTYGFEPTDLEKMKQKSYELSKQINSL